MTGTVCGRNNLLFFTHVHHATTHEHHILQYM
jgi:hypothetical protein